MWNALMAAVIGIFGGLFGIGASAGMIHQSAEEAPRPTIESSWWENGNQVNEESHGAPTNPEEYGVPKPQATTQTRPTEDADASIDFVDISGGRAESGGGDNMTALGDY